MAVPVVLACALWPAMPADATTATLTPASVTIGPDQAADQTVHTGGSAGEVIVWVLYEPQPPAGFVTVSRGNGTCRNRGEGWRCDGWRDVVLTYPALISEAQKYRVTVRLETAEGEVLDRANGWVEVQAPPPPTTEAPVPTDPPTSEQPPAAPTSQPSEASEAPPSTTEAPSAEPTEAPTTATAPTTAPQASDSSEPPPAQPEGDGLATTVLAVGGSVGLVGLAGMLVGLLNVRRSREARQEPKQPRPEVAVETDDEPESG